MRRYAYFIAVALAAIAIGGAATVAGGRAPIPFLVAATVALGWVVWLLFAAAAALSRPAGTVDAGLATGRRRKELEREKQALLKALKELDFDHEMGKVSDKDFADIGAQYRARAIRVMRRLDDAGRDYEQMIAADVAKRLRKAGVTAAASSAPSDACPKCQTRNDADAAFCKRCGGKLQSEAAS